MSAAAVAAHGLQPSRLRLRPVTRWDSDAGRRGRAAATRSVPWPRRGADTSRLRAMAWTWDLTSGLSSSLSGMPRPPWFSAAAAPPPDAGPGGSSAPTSANGRRGPDRDATSTSGGGSSSDFESFPAADPDSWAALDDNLEAWAQAGWVSLPPRRSARRGRAGRRGGGLLRPPGRGVASPGPLGGLFMAWAWVIGPAVLAAAALPYVFGGPLSLSLASSSGAGAPLSGWLVAHLLGAALLTDAVALSACWIFLRAAEAGAGPAGARLPALRASDLPPRLFWWLTGVAVLTCGLPGLLTASSAVLLAGDGVIGLMAARGGIGAGVSAAAAASVPAIAAATAPDIAAAAAPAVATAIANGAAAAPAAVAGAAAACGAAAVARLGAWVHAACLTALLPYMAAVLLQGRCEVAFSARGSPAWPLVPAVFEGLRALQLSRGLAAARLILHEAAGTAAAASAAAAASGGAVGGAIQLAVTVDALEGAWLVVALKCFSALSLFNLLVHYFFLPILLRPTPITPLEPEGEGGEGSSAGYGAKGQQGRPWQLDPLRALPAATTAAGAAVGMGAPGPAGGAAAEGAGGGGGRGGAGEAAGSSGATDSAAAA